MRQAVIVSTARTPIGKAYRGAFNNTQAQELAAHAIWNAVQRAGLEGGEVEDVNLYYLLSTAIAGQTVLRDELMGRIRPWSLFHTAIERGLEQRARDAGRPNPVQFIPTGFQQSPRLLCDEVPDAVDVDRGDVLADLAQRHLGEGVVRPIDREDRYRKGVLVKHLTEIAVVRE